MFRKVLSVPRSRAIDVAMMLNPVHHPREIFVDGEITARQLLQRSYAILSMVDRPEKSATQTTRPACVHQSGHSCCLLSAKHSCVDCTHDLVTWGFSRSNNQAPRFLLQSDMQVPRSLHKLKNGGCLRFDDALHH